MLQTTERMMSTSPNPPIADMTTLGDCIDACVACELACLACADACLGEDEVESLRKCIRLNLDCGDICAATARLLSRSFETDPALLRAQLEACAVACDSCGAECQRHADHHEHCQVCSEACQRCEELCRQLIDEL